MKALVNTIFKTSWSASRIIRFAIGIGFVISYFVNNNSILLMLGLIFGIQGLLNAGCAGSNCDLPKN